MALFCAFDSRSSAHAHALRAQLLLLEKNRALESENTDLKLQAQQALASVQELTV
jgi:hypothetical protein